MVWFIKIEKSVKKLRINRSMRHRITGRIVLHFRSLDIDIGRIAAIVRMQWLKVGYLLSRWIPTVWSHRRRTGCFWRYNSLDKNNKYFEYRVILYRSKLTDRVKAFCRRSNSDDGSLLCECKNKFSKIFIFCFHSFSLVSVSQSALNFISVKNDCKINRVQKNMLRSQLQMWSVRDRALKGLKFGLVSIF